MRRWATSAGKRRGRAVVLAALAVLMLPATSQGAAGNLLTNPGFEEYVLPEQAVEVIRLGCCDQPILPVGWTFEGLTELFDHTYQRPRSGRYAAAISGSWSGSPKECFQPVADQCATNPTTSAKDDLTLVYRLAPAWRTANPVPVSGGKWYALHTWVRLQMPNDGTGARTYVRWLDASGVPIGVSAGPSRSAKGGTVTESTLKHAGLGPWNGVDFYDWKAICGKMKAPANAASAHVLLGFSHENWISQVVYDDAWFGLESQRGC